ncbi:MAG: ATP-binding protein [Halobacteriota archaeon]
MELHIGESFSIDPSALVTERSAVIGQSGSGKSYLVSVICEELAKNDLGFVVIDTEGEYSGLAELPNIKVVDDVERIAKDEVYVKELIQKSKKIVLDVSEAEPKTVDEFLHSIYRVGTELFRQGAHNRVPFLIVVEEADIYIPQKLNKGLEILQVISRRGRKRGLGILFATQRPALVNKNVLSQCNNVFIGKLTLKNDIDSVRIFFSSLDVARELTTLEPGHFYVQGSIADPAFITVRQRKTSHKGSTPTIKHEEPKVAECSQEMSPPTSSQPTEHVASEAMRTRLALNVAQGSKRILYLAFDEGRVVDAVSNNRRKQFKFFGKSESMSDLTLLMAPIFTVTIREVKKRLVGTRVNEYTILVDAISGDLLSADGARRLSHNLNHLIGLNAQQLQLMELILSDTGMRYATLHEAFPERGLKARLKALQERNLISVNGERYYPLYDIDYPKSLETQRADGLHLKEGHVEHVLKPRLQKQKLKELIRGLYPGCEVVDAAVIYSPVLEVSYTSDESNRRVRIDGLTGKVVRST